MRILVTGSRNWADRAVVETALSRYWNPAACPVEQVLVSGACPTGADKLCEEVWVGFGGEVERHPADWGTHGKSAGPRRNQQMVDLGADVCLAFLHDDSRGTKHCAAAAETAGIPVVRWRE